MCFWSRAAASTSPWIWVLPAAACRSSGPSARVARCGGLPRNIRVRPVITSGGAGSARKSIKLAGNVELACLAGLADAVVDIVETGSTLRANDLEELEVILHSSARFVVNRAALKLKTDTLRPLIHALRAQIAQSGVR